MLQLLIKNGICNASLILILRNFETAESKVVKHFVAQE